MAFFSPLEQFDAVFLLAIRLGAIDISFTNIFLPLLIADVFIVLITLIYKTSCRLVPGF
jgi:hypothetical protein